VAAKLAEQLWMNFTKHFKYAKMNFILYFLPIQEKFHKQLKEFPRIEKHDCRPLTEFKRTL